MQSCPFVGGCAFFNDKMADMPATTQILKQNYCKDVYARCARYVVREAMGPDAVPDDLFPNANPSRLKEILTAA